MIDEKADTPATAETPNARPYISHSQLNLYSNCGEAYRRRYIEGEKIPPGVALLRGTAVHGMAEVNHRQKITSGVDLPLGDLTDATATKFEEAKANGYSLLPEEQGTNAVGQAKDAAVRLTGLYAREVAPAIMPALVEERVRIILPDAAADMLGVMDVATVDRRVKDLKTKARSETQANVDTSLQLTWYAMTYRAKTGVDPSGLDLEVLVDAATPKHQRLSTTRARRDFEMLVNRINVTLAAIKAGVFPPANPSWWGCSTRFCGYAPTCRFYVDRKET